MEYAVNFFTFIQCFFAVVIGLYFWNLLRSQQGNRIAVERESRQEIDKLAKMRAIALTVPLSEKTRPMHFSEMVGQEEGLKALRAALCGPNPQHVLMYGPPGVGKTAAARLVLDEARKNPLSPFGEHSSFTELDATTARFDERGIADPLIGTVHDPIYQGAGPLGVAGIPQPKPGAVTKAHGGILFIDEIGELHQVQINKLLKVLEDRRVFFESSYYNREDKNIPLHIHDIFQNGLPADFRLVGATTRMPQDLPPALRSRCVEIYFRPLEPDEIGKIARTAIRKIHFAAAQDAIDVVQRYATNGREAVNIVQIAAGIAMGEHGKRITKQDVEWVINFSHYDIRPDPKIRPRPQIGMVNGLALCGPNMGMMMEIEAAAQKVAVGMGRLTITGIVDEEEIGGSGKVLRRKSMARGSVENVMTVLQHEYHIPFDQYAIHVNFPAAGPVDGPSAGAAIAAAIYSAVNNLALDNTIALTGELSIHGLVKPVGGVAAKIMAAERAGVKKVLIPRENDQELFKNLGIEVIAVDTLQDIFRWMLIRTADTSVKLEVLLPKKESVTVPVKI